MKKELKEIIQELAQIQIEALLQLKASPYSVDQYQLHQLIEYGDNDIIEVLENRIKYWKLIQEIPEAIMGISPYQLGVCTHILFTMEETWVQNNPDGIIALWDLFDIMYQKFHPEIKLLWLPKKTS